MAHLIHVGNSLGIRIPKAILSQLGFRGNTELQLKIIEEGLLISSIKKSRSDWSEAFEKVKKEPLLMGDHIENVFDQEEWEW